MNLENHITKYLGVIALVFALMLPTCVEFSHLFENHEHEVCHEQTTHLHKDAPQCHSCDFYSSSFQYILPENYLLALEKSIASSFILIRNHNRVSGITF